MKVLTAYLLLIAALAFTNIYGIVLCFKASVILGVASLFVQGAGAAESLIYWIGGYDVAAHLAAALGLAA